MPAAILDRASDPVATGSITGLEFDSLHPEPMHPSSGGGL
jgi:hypothetical protein